MTYHRERRVPAVYQGTPPLHAQRPNLLSKMRVVSKIGTVWGLKSTDTLRLRTSSSQGSKVALRKGAQNSRPLRELVQWAIENYDEVIRPSSHDARACFSQALAYTALGQDREAEQDIQKAVELGIDAGLLRAAVEQVKAPR